MRDELSFGERLPSSELTAMFKNGRAVEYQRDKHLMREGDVGNCVILVRTGLVKISRCEGDGRIRLLGIRGPGELLGEMACLENRPRSATVVALDRVTGTWLACELFLARLQRSAVAAREVACQISRRLRAAERHQESLTTECVQARLVQALLKLAVLFTGKPDPVNARIQLNQCELAQLTGASIASTHRALRELCHLKLVTTSYGGVVVPCVDCLRKLPDSLTRGCGSPDCPQG